MHRGALNCSCLKNLFCIELLAGIGANYFCSFVKMYVCVLIKQKAVTVSMRFASQCSSHIFPSWHDVMHRFRRCVKRNSKFNHIIHIIKVSNTWHKNSIIFAKCRKTSYFHLISNHWMLWSLQWFYVSTGNTRIREASDDASSCQLQPSEIYMQVGPT